MRYLKAGVGFLVAAFLMASTSADISSEGSSALSRDSLPALDDIGDVSIDMWQHTYEPLANWTQARIDEFTADHPNVSVDFQSVPFAQYQDKLFTAIAAGNAPTFFEVNDWSMTQFVEAGVLAPLDPVALGFESLEAMRADYEGTALDGAIVDDVLYGSPYDWTAPVLGVYNELLDANGVDPSTLTTWEGTLAAAALMSEEDGDGNLVTSGLSFVHGNDNYYKHQGNTLFRQAGAQLLTDDGMAAAINSPEAKRVFEFWRDAVHTEHVTDPGFTSTFYTNEFGEGRVATGFMLTWANSILVPFEFTFGEEYDILPLPTFEGGQDELAGYSWNWTLNQEASPEEAAATHALIAYLSENSASMLTEAGLILPRTDWYESQTPDVQAQYATIREALLKSVPVERHPRYNEIWEPVIAVFEAVEADPEADIDVLLENAAIQIDGVINRP